MSRRAQRRQRTTSRIAVIPPSRSITGERLSLLPRQYYADFGAATRDLSRRFRHQFAPLMALVPNPDAAAIYLFAPRDVARREDVEARMWPRV